MLSVLELHHSSYTSDTSDFEGFARVVGEGIPGDVDPLFKRLDVYSAIHQVRYDWFDQLGL